MKRFLSLVVLFSALTMAGQAQGVKFGIKGGLDVTNMSFDEKVFDTSNKAGWFIGPSVKVALPIVGLGVDISAFYDQKKSEVNNETITQKNILIPVNARFNLGLGSKASLYLAAGPQVSFNVGDDEFKWTDKSNLENTFQLKKSAFSINLGAGVTVMDHLEIGFAYNIGLGKTADASVKNALNDIKDDTAPKSWQISAAYYF
jgi:opacity protein-like surface antigen